MEVIITIIVLVIMVMALGILSDYFARKINELELKAIQQERTLEELKRALKEAEDK